MHATLMCVTFPKLRPSILLAVAWLSWASTAVAEEPRRTDHGDLIVLDVYGSYREMGAQAAELLGDDVRRVLELNLGFYERARSGGLKSWLFDHVALPLAARFMADDTGVSEEAAGYAEALGISRADYLRALIGTDAPGGSTVFLATRTATADGHALIGRNVDWIDFGGLLKPTVTRYHPDNGDLDHISAGWPLLQIPTIGLNEKGLAFSLNYFDTDPQMEPTAMSYPYRRVLQRASSVEEAIALFQADFPIIIPCFGALADASGDIALLECTTTACEVFRPEGDWFAHSNHARSEAMIPLDRFRGRTAGRPPRCPARGRGAAQSRRARASERLRGREPLRPERRDRRARAPDPLALGPDPALCTVRELHPDRDR
jgi:hypothetical protein